MARFFLIDSWLADAKGHNYQYALDVGAAAHERGYEPVLAVRERLAEELRFPTDWRVERLFHFGDAPRHWLGLYGRNPYPCDQSGRWLPNPSIRWWTRLLGFPAQHDRRRRINRFASDCSRLFAKIPPNRGDIFFLPSLTEFDLLCAVKFWRAEAWTSHFDWHLQFHFNFFLGRDPEFDQQSGVLRDLQRQFRSAVDLIPEHRLHFYATSDAVARQYNSLGIAIFHPLPYPVRSLLDEGFTEPQSEKQPKSTMASPVRPLQVTLPGAMRHEKGKKQIGALIDAVWDEFLQPGKHQFVFQATAKSIEQRLPERLRGLVQNGALRILELGSRGATAPLKTEPLMTAPLMTVPHPLDAEAYANLIQRSDIGLFVYDARRYFARVSGVLCEMLSAGVPVIVPAGCWLADQIAEENYRHIDLLWRTHRNTVDEIRFPSDPNMPVTMPALARSLLVTFDWPATAGPGTYVEVIAEPSVDGNLVSGSTIREILGSRERGSVGTVIQFSQPVKTVRFSFRGAFGSEVDWQPRARLLPLPMSPLTSDPPRARVGLIAAHERDMPRLLAEMTLHYGHYRRSVREFAGLWQSQHSPNRTLELLASRTWQESSEANGRAA